jgi:hypothetical protein
LILWVKGDFFKRNTHKLHVCDAYILEYGRFIEIDIEEAMNRVEKRHIATGMSSNLSGV